MFPFLLGEIGSDFGRRMNDDVRVFHAVLTSLVLVAAALPPGLGPEPGYKPNRCA